VPGALWSAAAGCRFGGGEQLAAGVGVGWGWGWTILGGDLVGFGRVRFFWRGAGLGDEVAAALRLG
jgi:hypothetical protein